MLRVPVWLSRLKSALRLPSGASGRTERNRGREFRRGGSREIFHFFRNSELRLLQYRAGIEARLVGGDERLAFRGERASPTDYARRAMRNLDYA